MRTRNVRIYGRTAVESGTNVSDELHRLRRSVNAMEALPFLTGGPTGPIPTAGNPTAEVTLTTQNGVAVTFMRSDAAPRLSQAISPNMTGTWNFTPSANAVPVTINKTPTLSASLLDILDTDATPLVRVDAVGHLGVNCNPDGDAMMTVQGSGVGLLPVMSGLLGWYKADSYVGTFTNGQFITSNWVDPSGVGPDLIPKSCGRTGVNDANTAHFPTFFAATGVAETIQSHMTYLPTVSLASTQDDAFIRYFEFDGGQLDLTSTGIGWTIFLIERNWLKYAGGRCDEYICGTDGLDNFIYVADGATGGANVQFKAGKPSVGAGLFNVPYGITYGNTTDYVVLRCDDSGSFRMWRNGTLLTGTGSSRLSGAAAMVLQYVGRHVDANGCFSTELAEIGFFGRTLTTDEIDDLNVYMAARIAGTPVSTVPDLTHWNDATTATLSRIDGAGQFGFGVTTPTSPVHIRLATGSPQMQLEYDASIYANFTMGGSGTAVLQSTGDWDIRGGTTYLGGGSARLTLTTTGDGEFRGGSSLVSGNPGGRFSITGGNGLDESGGVVNIFAGAPTGTGDFDGSDVQIGPSAGIGAGADGYIKLYQSSTNYAGIMDLNLLTADRIFVWPNVAGTLPVGTGTASEIAVWSGTNELTSSTLSAAGIVSGGGTLNVIPKWTPDGVTLGNSDIFDNGTNMYLTAGSALGGYGTVTLSGDTGGQAGSFLFAGGTGTGPGSGGGFQAQGGTGGATSGAGGSITLVAGSASGGNGAAGVVSLRYGSRSGVGATGDIGFLGPSGIRTSLTVTATSPRFIAYPDASGTLALTSDISAATSDTAYDATTWNGVTTIAPSKNAVRDKFETKTGSGNLVYDNTPTLITPVLGVATATTINKLTITQPATGSTLTIDDGKTFRVRNSLDCIGTDGTTQTFPTTNAVIARTDAAQTFTGVQTFSSQDVHNAGVSLGTSGVLTSAVSGTGVTAYEVGSAVENNVGNVGFRIRNTVRLSGSKPLFEVDFNASSTPAAAYVPVFSIWSIGANNGTDKEFRFGYDASNYLAMKVNTVGTSAFATTGSTGNLSFQSSSGSVGFTAATNVTFTATAGNANFNTPSILLKDGIVLSNVANITGTTIGAAADKLGFFAVAPAGRPGVFTQTYATASHTHPTLTSTAVATTAATNVVPYGYTTQAQADDIITQLNALRTDLDNLKQVVNAVIDDGQSLGLLA